MVADETTVVVIVDDDASVRRALSRLIKLAGVKVESFASAEEFLKARRGATCSCLILDVHMPGMSGLQLQGRLCETGSQIPIIFISAYEEPQVRTQAMRLGARAFFRKPFDDQVLLETVASALRLA